MSQSARSFDRLFIPAPCDADWDSMIGNSRVRFCKHCNLHVTNLSAITRPEAMRLVAQSEGRLCLRFEQRSDGSVITKQSPPTLHQIGRRVSLLAAGAFGATLSLASAVPAQVSSRPREATGTTENQLSPQKQKAADAGGKFQGTIFDSSGEAVVPNAIVRLVNTTTGVELTAMSLERGEYTFENVALGTYNLTVNAPGFVRYDLPDISVREDVAQTQNVQLQTGGRVMMGVVAISQPRDPLVRAAWKNDIAAVAQLLSTALEVDKSDEATNTTALTYAVENNNREMIRLLLASGANINATNRQGETSLMHLRAVTDIDLVRDLIAAGADVNARTESGDTPLMRAAEHCTFAVVKELIDAGADVNVKDEGGNTLLMQAAQNDDSEIVKFLISAGVSVEATNADGESALTLAASWEKRQNVEVLLDAGGGAGLTQEQLDRALASAAGNEDAEIVRTLLRLGANANAEDGDRDLTALMIAAESGRSDIIKILVAAGAEVNAVDEDGCTALMQADNAEAARALLDAGANPALRNKDGETALGTAIEDEREDVVKLLKSRGAHK